MTEVVGSTAKIITWYLHRMLYRIYHQRNESGNAVYLNFMFTTRVLLKSTGGRNILCLMIKLHIKNYSHSVTLSIFYMP
jgi:hypothetical protein